MDKIKGTAIEAYEQGFRAYVYADGKHFYKHQETGMEHKVYGTMDQWHALRAYQDEQRKKGVPILWEQVPYDFVEDLATAYQAVSGRMDGTFTIRGYTDLLSKHPHGQFTNFRWREGYPKKNDHYAVIRDGDNKTLYKNGEKVKAEKVTYPLPPISLKMQSLQGITGEPMVWDGKTLGTNE